MLFFLLLFSLRSFADEGLPSELKVLQYKRDKKIAEVDKVYRKELMKLREVYIKRGDFKSAGIVSAILKEKGAGNLAEQPALPKSSDDVLGFLDGTVWSSNGDRFVFDENGTFKGGKWNCKVLVTGLSTLTIVWNKSISIKCKFNKDYTKMVESSGQRNTFVRVDAKKQ